MIQVHPPFWSRWLYADIKWSFPSHKGELHFSFDDGPNPNTTPQLLQLLDDFEAKATFFCLGCNLERYPFLKREIENRGHLIANHGYRHVKGWSSQVLIKNANQGTKYSNSLLFRPPYGLVLPKAYNVLKKCYQIILWDVMAYDFDSRQTPKKCADRVINYAKDGSVIVFHDNEKSISNCLGALRILLPYYQQRGVCFTTIA
jgi:peptidoglycan-N-acetylglucosamine deacetylase